MKMTIHLDGLAMSRRVFAASMGKLVHCHDAQATENKQKKSFCHAIDTMRLNLSLVQLDAMEILNLQWMIIARSR